MKWNLKWKQWSKLAVRLFRSSKLRIQRNWMKDLQLWNCSIMIWVPRYIVPVSVQNNVLFIYILKGVSANLKGVCFLSLKEIINVHPKRRILGIREPKKYWYSWFQILVWYLDLCIIEDSNIFQLHYSLLVIFQKEGEKGEGKQSWKSWNTASWYSLLILNISEIYWLPWKILDAIWCPKSMWKISIRYYAWLYQNICPKKEYLFH